MARTRIAALFVALLAAAGAHASAPAAAPSAPKEDAATLESLALATQAVVQVKARALANARSNATLGRERVGSGVLIGPRGLVLTIGYLILEAESVELTSANGKTVPAVVAAYDHATGFGLLRPLAPLEVKPARLGASAALESAQRLLVAGHGGEAGLSVATVVSVRQFVGYWEYLIDGAIFTSPPRADFAGAGLFNRAGELVGVGSLFVMDAVTPRERLPGNMFVPVDLLKPILDEMVATGRQKGGARPWLGVSSLEEDGRIKVMRVSAGSPAEEAGLAPGDIILGISGEKVERLDDFYKRLWSAGAPGVEVKLRVLKGTEIREVPVRSIDRFENIRKMPTI